MSCSAYSALKNVIKMTGKSYVKLRIFIFMIVVIYFFTALILPMELSFLTETNQINESSTLISVQIMSSAVIVHPVKANVSRFGLISFIILCQHKEKLQLLGKVPMLNQYVVSEIFYILFC